MKVKLMGKGIDYVLEKTETDFAWIKNPKAADRLTTSTTSSTSTSESSRVDKVAADLASWGSGSWNIQKKEDYRVASGRAIDFILQSLCEEDQALYDEHASAMALWTALKVKHSRTNKNEANSNLANIANFVYDAKLGVNGCWAKLKEYRRKLIAANALMKNSYPDEGLLMIFTRTMPIEFRATIDVLKFQLTMTVDEKLKALYEVEERNKEANDKESEESAHIARGSKYIPPYRRNSNDSTGSDSRRKYNTVCLLCDENHYIRNCPNIPRARKLILEYRKNQKKNSSEVKDAKVEKKHFSSSKHASKFKHKHTTNRSKAYAAKSNDEVSDSEHDSETESTSSTESCALSTSNLSKADPSSWIVDTGASSHMTDQRSNFRSLKRVWTKGVKVGGGVLRCNYIGEAELKCRDGSSMLLSNVLFVPDLGVNLLSVRRLCQTKTAPKFVGNDEKLYLMDGERKIVSARMQDGLYCVTNVAKGYEETALNTQEQVIKSKPDESHESDNEATTQKDRARYLRYHKRFAHLGPKKIANLHHVTTTKRIKVPKDLSICEVCALTKLRNKIPKELAEWAKTLLGRIQFDVAGPFPVTIRGNRWFLLIIDTFSRRNWVIPLKTKGDAYEALLQWKLQIELQTGKKVKSARSDNAPELLKAIEQWEVETGFEGQSTTIASSHQNGPAERSIQTVEADMRALLEEAKLPIEFWDEAAEVDAYVRNRTDVGLVIDGKKTSPIGAFTGHPPSIDHIRRWGSKCYYYVDRKTVPARERHDKLINPGRVGVFMGYSDKTNKHFKVYSPERGCTIVVSVVRIDEEINGGEVELKLRNCESGSQGTMNVMKDRKPRGRPAKALEPIQEIPIKITTTPPQVITPRFTPPANIPVFAKEDMPDIVDKEVEHVPLEPIESPDLDKATKNKNHKNKERTESQSSPTLSLSPREMQPTVEDAIEESNIPAQPIQASPVISKHISATLAPIYFTRGNAKRAAEEQAEGTRDVKRIRAMIAKSIADNEVDLDEFEELLGVEIAFPAEVIAGILIPRTYKEAVEDPTYGERWKAAIAEELLALYQNQTFREVILPKGANRVSCKWVFTVKTLADGTIERFKARLVARGFSQVYGEDYTETFAPTVRMDTLRLFLATVAAEDLECYQFDIKNAFTESHLKEEIYLEPPQGVLVPKGRVWQALRSLYGLKQAARDWNKLMRDELLGWGFVQSLADPCLFTHSKRSTKLLVYVDDIVASAEVRSDIDWFYGKLKSRFNTKSLGEIEKILGARVTRDRKAKSITIDQEQYLTRVLERFGITSEKAKGKKIPAADYNNLRPATNDDTRINTSEYQQAIGSLMYAMVFTRPDIAYVLGKLSQFMSDPAEHHGHALKYLFRYLKSTATLKIVYSPTGGVRNLGVYSDADWATAKEDRKSVSGSVSMFYGGPVSWSSKKQRSVSTSSCESEYIALSSCAKQGQWLGQVLRDLGLSKYVGKDPRLVQMYGDNQGAIALTQNAHLNERSKHIDICYHFIRDLAEQRRLRVDFIPTDEMIADGMTKPLQRVKFERFKEQMGMQR